MEMDINYDDLIGVPFEDGGRSINGLDCWGLAKILYGRMGIEIPEYTISSERTHDVAVAMKYEFSTKWKRLETPKKGCLVAIRLQETEWANHCGIVLDHGYFIHAYCYETGVVIDRLRKWKSRIIGYYWPKEGGVLLND